MATVSVKDVQSLNKRIEKINTEKTRVETRSQMLKDQILTDIKAYKDKFGVDLYANSFAEIKKLISAEAKKVASEVSEEYELKEKVVGCIERGDIDEANKLLGITEESPEEQEEQVEEEETYESLNTDDIEEEEDTKKEEDFKLNTVEGSMESASYNSNEDLVMEDDSTEDLDDEKEETVGDFDMSVDDDEDEDDDDDDPFGFGEMLSGGKF